MALRCPVRDCGRQMPGGNAICGCCEGDLARALGDVPWLVRELRVTMSRQGRRPATGRAREVDDDPYPATLHPTPLPLDLGASDVLELLTAALDRWHQTLLGRTVRPAGPVCGSCEHPSCGLIVYTTPPTDRTPVTLSRWLLHRHHALVARHDPVRAYADIVLLVQRAEQVIDRPPELWYAGPCLSCGEDLYAQPAATLVRCVGCGREYGVKARRSWLLATVEDTLATAAQAEHILTLLEWPVTAARIRLWAHRGRIAAHGIDHQARPLYRVGDIKQLLAEAAERAREGEAKRAGRHEIAS